jgi:dihydroorotase
VKNELVKTVVKGGKVVTPDGVIEADVLIDGGVIIEIGTGLSAPNVVDAGGAIVGPGLVDLHTHLREPGREEAETIETGSRAAALGGYAAVVAMPNTEPAIDSVQVVRYVQDAAARAALCDVEVAGSITVNRAGEKLSPMAEMAEAGVRIFTDDGSGVQDPRLMLRALEYSSMLDVTLAQHCEDESLSAGGHMHEGAVSSRLGIAGIPVEAEEVMVMRDIALARRTSGARLHFLHLSTETSVQLVAAAKASGLNITAEATPHHFTLTDELISNFDPVFKVNPPIRSQQHVDAVKAGLLDGTIDAIATDHAPHAPELKELPFDEAPCGMLGLQTALALALTELGLPIERVFELLSTNPARIARIDDRHGLIAVGREANLVVVDPDEVWEVDAATFASKSVNTPYAGRRVRGRVRHTLLRGEPVVVNGKATR